MEGVQSLSTTTDVVNIATFTSLILSASVALSLEEIELGEEGCGGTEASMFKKSTMGESLQGLQSGERQVCSKQAPSRRCCVLKHLLHYSFGL